jgi:hypothetical protein
VSLWPPPRPGDKGAERARERYARTLDPVLLRDAIERAVAAGEVDELSIDRLETRPLGIKKDRFITCVDIDDARRGRLELVAKGYHDDRAVRVAHNHRALWEGGLGGDATVRTSRPWGVVASLGVALSERLPGEAPELLDAAAARRAAQAAARLHACDGGLEPAFTREAALANAERHAKRLVRRLATKREHQLALRAAVIAKRARAVAATLAPAEPRPVHGDLSLDSLLFDEERTFLIDWDISCRFDPAWDVGHFLAQQRRFGLETGVDTGPVRAAFLAAYLDARGADGEFESRAAFYEALTYLHKTMTVQRTPEEALIPALLELADAGFAALG